MAAFIGGNVFAGRAGFWLGFFTAHQDAPTEALMHISSTTKDKMVVNALQGLEAHLVEDEQVKYLSYVLNIRPGIGAFAVTEVRVILLNYNWGIWNELPFYDIENWVYDARKRHFQVWLKDQAGIVLKGIESVDSPMLLDVMAASAATPLDDPRVVALARRNRRNDIDVSSHAPQTVPSSDAHEVGQSGVVQPARELDIQSVGPAAAPAPEAAQPSQPPAPPTPPTPLAAPQPAVQAQPGTGNSLADELDRLIGMFDRGLLSQEEFSQAKQRLLEG
jgi:hypothetical protein